MKYPSILLSYLPHHYFNLIPAIFYPLPPKAVLGKTLFTFYPFPLKAYLGKNLFVSFPAILGGLLIMEEI